MKLGNTTARVATLVAGLACSAMAFGQEPMMSFGQAPILYKTGFEPPTFTAGQPLVGQQGWIAPPPLSPNAAVVSTERPRVGRQSVRVAGADLEHQDFINEVTGGYYDAIGSYRRPVCQDTTKPGCTEVDGFKGYDTRGKQTVTVSAHVRVDGSKLRDGKNFFSASIGAVALGEQDGELASEGVGELAISSDGKVYGYTGADSVPVILASDRVTLNEWHTLTVQADFKKRMTTFFVDDDCVGIIPFDARVTTDVLLRGSMLVYAAPDTKHAHKADYSAHFDQFSIKVSGPR
jgi:hypothetical protein